MLTNTTIAALAACVLASACLAPAVAKDRTSHQGTKTNWTVSRAGYQSYGAVLPNGRAGGAFASERLPEPSYMAIQSKGYHENN